MVGLAWAPTFRRAATVAVAIAGLVWFVERVPAAVGVAPPSTAVSRE